MNLFSTNTQLFYYRLTSTIFSIAERTIPRTKPCNKVSVPRWNKSCQIAINHKKHALNRMLETSHPSNIKIFKRTRAKAKKILNAAKQSCWENYCSSISSNAKLGQVWSNIQRFTGQQTSSHFPCLQQHSITSTNNQHKTNTLANQFQATSSNENFTSKFQNHLQSVFLQLHQKLNHCTSKKMGV